MRRETDQVFFSCYHSGGADKAKRAAVSCLRLQSSGDLDHDEYGKFLLSLRDMKFASEECRVLGLTCFDKTTTDCLSPIPA